MATALYFGKDGRTTRTSISVGPRGLTVHEGEPSLLLDIFELTARVGGETGTEWIFERPAGDAVIVSSDETKEYLYTSDQPWLRNLLKDIPSRERNERSRLPRTLAIFSVSLIAILLALWFGILGLARFAISKVPVSWEESLGDISYGANFGSMQPVDDPTVTKAVQEIFDTLVRYLPEHPYKLRLAVLPSKTVNAFALPGGQMVVLTAFLAEAESPEEVAGVMAHEMQHVLQRHSLEAIGEDVGLGFAISLVGNMIGIPMNLQSLAQEVKSLSYSRSSEQEADLEAVKVLHAAGISAKGMAAFFERLAKEEGAVTAALTFLSTHPGSEDRMRSIEELIVTERGMKPMAVSVPWDEVQKAAKAISERSAELF